MKKEIEKLIELSSLLRLTANQTLFLVAYREGIYTVDIPAEELYDLVVQGFMKGNKVTLEGLERLEAAWQQLAGPVVSTLQTSSDFNYPILTKETGNIVKVLAKHFHRGELTTKDVERLMVYNKNVLAIPFLFIFLQMFPTADSTKNKAWQKHFGDNGSGVTLRKMSNGTARKFQSIWKKKDIGLFLLGTYLCIKQSYNAESGKYYVKKIENYLAEWEHWYQQAEDMLLSGELEEYTKTPTTSATSSRNTVVI